jgi:hypothetical protein
MAVGNFPDGRILMQQFDKSLGNEEVRVVGAPDRQKNRKQLTERHLVLKNSETFVMDLFVRATDGYEERVPDVRAHNGILGCSGDLNLIIFKLWFHQFHHILFICQKIGRVVVVEHFFLLLWKLLSFVVSPRCISNWRASDGAVFCLNYFLLNYK